MKYLFILPILFLAGCGEVTTPIRQELPTVSVRVTRDAYDKLVEPKTYGGNDEQRALASCTSIRPYFWEGSESKDYVDKCINELVEKYRHEISIEEALELLLANYQYDIEIEQTFSTNTTTKEVSKLIKSTQ